MSITPEAQIEAMKGLEYDFYSAKMMATLLADTLDDSIADLTRYDDQEA